MFRIKVKYIELCCVFLFLVFVFFCILDSVFFYKVIRIFLIFMLDFLVCLMRNLVYVCFCNLIKRNMYKCWIKFLMLGCWRLICK